MTHNLSEPIPSAEPFSAEEDIDLALNRFRKSLADFKDYQGDLAPHFAYGKLSKGQYEVAHAIHFYNHLLEIDMLNKPKV